MERKDFQELLLRSAVSVMACDGEIHESEMEEIRQIVQKASFFKDINPEEVYEKIIGEIQSDPRLFIQFFLTEVKRDDLSTLQKLLLLEVMLRLVNADQVIHECEIQFLKIVTGYMQIHDDLIVQRFGEIDYLTQTKLSKFVIKSESDIIRQFSDFESLKIESLNSIDAINVENDKNE